MSIVYLLQNQDSQLLSKSGEWVDQDTGTGLFRTAYRDEAINQKVEFSVKDAELRIKIVEAELNEKGVPQLLQSSNDNDIFAAPLQNLDQDTDTDTPVQAAS